MKNAVQATQPNLFRTSGNSMAPLLRDGTRVHVVPAAELVPGDIIAVRRGDVVLVHRFLRLRTRDGAVELHEKGDNRCVGSWVDAEALVGRVDRIEWEGRVRELGTPNRATRLLAAGSRVEAALCGPISRLHAPVRSRLSSRVANGLIAGVRYAAVPFKLLGVPLLKAAYPPARPVETPVRVLDLLLQSFRAAAGLDPGPFLTHHEPSRKAVPRAVAVRRPLADRDTVRRPPQSRRTTANLKLFQLAPARQG